MYALHKKRVITIHPEEKWMNDEIRQAKTQKRKAERTWRKTGLVVHKEIYVDLRNSLNKIISSSKREHYQECISKSSESQKSLFKSVDELLNKKEVYSLTKT